MKKVRERRLNEPSSLLDQGTSDQVPLAHHRCQGHLHLCRCRRLSCCLRVLQLHPRHLAKKSCSRLYGVHVRGKPVQLVVEYVS